MAQEVTKVFETPEGCDLVVRNTIEGRIAVTGWDKPQTQVTAVKHGDDIEIEISQLGRSVIAETTNIDSPVNRLGQPEKKKAVDYTVYVPRSSNVHVTCVTAPTRVADVEGAVRVENVDGSVELDNVSGQVQLSQLRPSRPAAR